MAVNGKVKHIGIISQTPRQLGKFYEAVFGVTMAGPRAGEPARPQAATPPRGGGGAAIFSDGYVGFNINGRTNGRPAGLNHWGLQIDSVEELDARLAERYPGIEIIKRPPLDNGMARPFAALGTHDPEGNIFDLSAKEEHARDSVYAEKREERLPSHLSHFMLPAINAPALAEFYRDIYDMQELPKDRDDANFYLSDGTVTIVIHPWKLSEFTGGLDGKPVIDHLGFRVEGIEKFLEHLDHVSREQPEFSPQPYTGEGEKRRQTLAMCAIGHYQMADPEGGLIDITEA